jgi:hypothetical protein
MLGGHRLMNREKGSREGFLNKREIVVFLVSSGERCKYTFTRGCGGGNINSAQRSNEETICNCTTNFFIALVFILISSSALARVTVFDMKSEIVCFQKYIVQCSTLKFERT